METEAIDFIDQAELDKVFDIVIEVTLTPLPCLRATPIEGQLEKITRTLVSYGIPGFVIMGVLGVMTMATHSQPLARTALTISILVQLVGIGIGGIGVLSGIIFLRKVKRSPYAPFLKHVANSFTFDLRYVNRLALCDLNAVRYVLSYYKFERITFERRVCLLGGAIGRVGVFPAVAALAALAGSLAKLPGAGTWVPSLVVVSLGFYFFHFAASGMLQKKDRVIAMLEFVVQSHGVQKASA